MVHRIVWRVASDETLEFWKERLARARRGGELTEDSLLFADPEGLEHELLLDAQRRAAADARYAPEIPSEHALQGFDGVRAYAIDPSRSERLLSRDARFRAGRRRALGGARGGPQRLLRLRRRPGGGQPAARAPARSTTWPSPRGSRTIEAWRERVAEAGAHPTPVIDRFYFRSVYFREPSGVLFEIATIGPGFAVDEDEAHLGEGLSLPPRFEPLRAQLEAHAHAAAQSARSPRITRSGFGTLAHPDDAVPRGHRAQQGHVDDQTQARPVARLHPHDLEVRAGADETQRGPM